MTNKEQQIARMKELGELLRNASKAYYAEDREIMSNLEYDKLYDELTALEKETGTVLSGSPTMTVGYEAVDELPKERHASPMLSLDKTKDVGELAAFAGDHEVLLSWKLDGLTVVLTYENFRSFRIAFFLQGICQQFPPLVTGEFHFFLILQDDTESILRFL